MPKEIKNPLQKNRARPIKQLGQNFLIDKNALKTIINASGINPDDIVLEIGPGKGILTIELAKKAKKVVAVEKDARMCEILKELLEGQNVRNVEIIKADIRNWKLKIENYKVVANIPYYLTSFIIKKFLEAENQPKEMILMIQKEVAQRICARPPRYAKRCGQAKAPNMSLLSISVQFYAEPEIIGYVSRKSFRPSPKVDSAIIKIIPKPGRKSTIVENLSKVFFEVVRAGFSHPRKQLINNLSTGLSLPRSQVQIWLQKNNIQPSQRAETLTLQDWIKLCEAKIAVS